jgi:hypothetical protein
MKWPDSGCRIWHQILNETNFGETNLTIVRYKLLTEVCSGGFEIQLIADDKVLARKVVVEDIYSENCISSRGDEETFCASQEIILFLSLPDH